MTDQGEAAINTASLSLFRFASLPARLWVLGQMGAARLAFMRMPEVGFYKLCGSGTGEGFTPRPNTAVWAILATWPDAASMANFARGDGPHGRAIAAVRAENWFSEELYARFRILDEWGSWDGKYPIAPKDAA